MAAERATAHLDEPIAQAAATVVRVAASRSWSIVSGPPTSAVGLGSPRQFLWVSAEPLEFALEKANPPFAEKRIAAVRFRSYRQESRSIRGIFQFDQTRPTSEMAP